MKTKTYNTYGVMTFKEVGAVMGITDSRVQQLEQRAFKKIKAYLLKRFGDSVTIEDILPILSKENHYEQMQVM